MPTVVGDDLVVLRRDGLVAHAAMIEAIQRAQREILLEMYWIGHDHVGEYFDVNCMHASPLSLAEWRRRSFFTRPCAWLAALLRPFL